jgi:hypothetical protein
MSDPDERGDSDCTNPAGSTDKTDECVFFVRDFRARMHAGLRSSRLP